MISMILVKGCLPLEQAAQVGGGVNIPGGVQEEVGSGTECYSLFNEVVSSQSLGLMALEVFSKLNIL